MEMFYSESEVLSKSHAFSLRPALPLHTSHVHSTCVFDFMETGSHVTCSCARCFVFLVNVFRVTFLRLLIFCTSKASFNSPDGRAQLGVCCQELQACILLFFFSF